MPLLVCRTVLDRAERCHIRVGFPSLKCRLLLKKYKAESTAFLVAQIFLLPARNTDALYTWLPKLQKINIGKSRAAGNRWLGGAT